MYNTNPYKFRIPKYYAKIISKNNINIKLDDISLSFPFIINASFRFEKNIIDIARETIMALIDRRILNAKECCASCIYKALNSLKEIKSDLINTKKQLKNDINSPLFYFIDYMIISINSFFDFMERNNLIDDKLDDKDHDIKTVYFDALEIIRNHIAQCMNEIAKIAKMQINNEHYAFMNGEIGWQENYYFDESRIIDIKI